MRATDKANALIRAATGREVEVQEEGDSQPIGGKSDGGAGGDRQGEPVRMNDLIRRATGRPAYDDDGNAYP